MVLGCQIGDNPPRRETGFFEVADEVGCRGSARSRFEVRRPPVSVRRKRYAEAVDDYKSTIELQKAPRDVGEWVFVELANIYAAIGRPCDAAVTILAWAAIDPSVRNTLKTRKMVEEYSAKGCAQNPAPTDIKKL